MRLPLNTEWTVPTGPCTRCNGGGRQWDGAGSREDCWECRGTGSRECQVIIEVYRRGFEQGKRAAASAGMAAYTGEAFPGNVRVLLDSHKREVAP